MLIFRRKGLKTIDRENTWARVVVKVVGLCLYVMIDKHSWTLNIFSLAGWGWRRSCRCSLLMRMECGGWADRKSSNILMIFFFQSAGKIVRYFGDQSFGSTQGIILMDAEVRGTFM
jgi:hypothetical protein